MLQAYTRVRPGVARYQPAPSGRECCGRCRFFVPQNFCGRVIGPVVPRGWCKFFSQEAVSQFGGSINTGMGPSLSLDFMTPGALDSRVAFTRASTATYFDATGTMQTAAVNAPRWDYDPVTKVLKGLLIEEPRANQVLNSIPTGAGWTAQNVTVTAAAGVAPDGTNTLVRMMETTTNTFHGNVFAPVQPLAASTIHTLSVFAKDAGSRYIQLTFDNGGSVGAYATFDLQAGAITGPLTAFGSAVLGTAQIQPVGNGFYRCSISNNILGATAARAQYFTANVATAGNFPPYVGNPANGLLVWGAQVEQGAFPTSYIPTTSVAVTRAQEVVTMPTTGWVNPAAGTLLIHGSGPESVATAARDWISIGTDSSNTTRIFQQVGGNTLTGQVFNAGAAVGVATTLTVMVPGRQVKAAMTYGGNGSVVKASVAGEAPISGAQTGATAGMNGSLFISTQGRATGNTGTYQRATYWPRQLSDAELQSVTT